MEPNKLNKIITEAVFGVLIIVPLIIGLSLYSRPAPPPPLSPTTSIYPRVTPTVTPTAPVPQVKTQHRFYVSGFAYDLSSSQTLANKALTTADGQQVSVGPNGYFTLPVGASTTQLTLIIEGYKPVNLNIGQDSENLEYIQNYGNVPFEADFAQAKWSAYFDSQMKATIQYPGFWIYQSQFSNPGSQAYKSITFSNGAGTIIVTLSNDPNPYRHNSIEEYSKNYNSNDSSEESRTQLTINGNPAVRIISKSNLVTTLIMRESDHMVFNWLLWDASSPNDEIYQRMMERFKY